MSRNQNYKKTRPVRSASVRNVHTAQTSSKPHCSQPDRFKTVPLTGDRPRVLLHTGGLPPPFRDIQETVHPVGWRMGQFHRHEFWQLVFNRSGVGEVQTETSFRIEQTQTVIMPPGLSHIWSNIGAVPLDLLNIHILPRQSTFEDLEKYLQALCANPSRMGLCPERPELLPLAKRLSVEFGAGKYGYKYQMAALLIEIVIAALRAGLKEKLRHHTAASPVSRIEKALWYIEANYAQPIELRDIGRILNVSPKHACELFKRETGISPLRHLRRVRVQKAMLLLEEATLRIKEIAAAVGCLDEHYFSRLFRKLIGVSPSLYRARRLVKNALP